MITPTLALLAALDLSSVMFISKSENKNQVHYGIHLDGSCMPAGAAPVYAYWRMLEKGPDVTEPLLSREQRGYGIGRQEVHGDEVRVTLRGLPARPILIHVRREPSGACAATAEMTLGGLVARLFNVHLVLGFLHVKAVLLTGWNAAGAVVRERVSP